MAEVAEKITDLYERHALHWDEDRGHARPAGEREWIACFLAQVPAGARILDLGCGSGEPIARDLIEAGFPVTGVDASPALIGLCRKRFPGEAWIAQDMRRLDLESRFGGIILWHSLFHLTPDDQQKLFPVLAAHADPGAALMFTSGTERGETIGRWRGEPLYHASLDVSDYESLLDANGFTLLTRVESDPTCGGATVWLARAAAA